MLQRWKQILTNWKNCYFIENIKDEQNINIESLTNLISHLRQNYNLDEPKSSVLDNVKEFILEKYPAFKFENGTAEPRTEDEVYMAASLLLFFVCVNNNSTDVHIKNAMCSELCSEDQKIILKFTKSLLECAAITYSEVQIAITDACGQDIAAMESLRTPTAETPPALRSIHCEVRRLQAALDAESFDRNYLQEELTRTNARVEKLLKEKEQHKLDIVNLKAKISICCGEQSESIGVEADDKSAKLTRQLHDLEEKLVHTQEELNEVVYQKDTYKAKVDELKQERDKWLTLHQKEASKAYHLSEELESERRQNQTLQELLAELRTHNKLNELNFSSLECDDPDASMHSLRHASICSEACANVIEVQLGEEKAKIVVLTQQLQTLQEQINELNRKAEAEKLALKDEVAERDINIFNLKHRINEEIEDRNNLKSHFDNEVTKLNNQINELEQTLKDNNSHFRAIIEKKMQEIQTLQEEKLSLIQSLNNKTSKFEKDVQDLKAEIDTEKQSKSNMKDSYENHLMKLNEKVLKRNNELVEFQNNICEKSEMIESLQLQLKKEKEASSALDDYCNSLKSQKFALESELKQQSLKINELQKNLQIRITNIEELNIEISNQKTSISNLNETCKELEAVKYKLVSEVKERDGKIEECLEDLENIKEAYCKEKDKLILDLDERNETVNSLQIQLKNEIEFKIELQEELSQLQTLKITLTENFEKLNSELTTLKAEVTNNEKTIDAMDLYIQEMKKSNDQANEKIQKMTEDIAAKENEIKLQNTQIEALNKSLEEETKKKYDLLSELEPLHEQVKSLCADNAQLLKDMSVKCQEIAELRDDVEELSQQLDDRELLIQQLEHKFVEECKKYDQFEMKAATEMTKLTNKINDTNNIASECANVLTKEIIEKDSINNKLIMEVECLKQDLQKAQMEIGAFVEKLAQELAYKNYLEDDYQTQYGKLENLTTQFTTEMGSKIDEINLLKTEIQSLTNSVAEKSKDISILQEQLTQEREAKSELSYQMRTETKKLKNVINDLEGLNDEFEQELKSEMDANGLVVISLKQENKQLHYAMEEDNINHEVVMKEKDNIIDNLEKTVKDDVVKFNDLRQYSEELKQSWEEYKKNTTQTLNEKNNLIKVKDTLVAELKKSAKEEATKFKNLHNYSEELIRSWEDYKLYTAASIVEKDEEITRLKNNITILEKTISEIDQTKNDLSEQIIEMKQNKEVIKRLLCEEKAAKDVIETEKEHVLNEIKALLSEKQQLAGQIKELTQTIAHEKCVVKTAEDENNALLSEKMKTNEKLIKKSEMVSSLTQDKECLTQQLVEERNSKEIAEKERDNLAEEIELLKARLIDEEKVKSELCQELKTLTQQTEHLQQNIDADENVISVLEEEKRILNEDLTRVKQSLADSLEKQIKKIDGLEVQKSDLESRVNDLNAELCKLQDTCQDIEDKLNSKKLEYEEIVNKLKEKDDELNYIQENVIQNMQRIIQESEDEKVILKENIQELTEYRDTYQQEAEKLKETLKSEQAIRYAIECEKISLEKNISEQKEHFEEMKRDLAGTINGLQDSCNKTAEQLKNKEQELVNINVEFKSLKDELQSLQDENKTISDHLLNSLDGFIEGIKNENYKNEKLQFADGDFKDISQSEKCIRFVQMAEALVSEIDLKNIELAKKNEDLVEVQESVNQKEIEIFELKTEVNRLQQIVNESKIEVSIQSETYSTAMNSKIKDIQTLQKENQTLHNDLNDVKVQLEVKVHSLKEKLVDNENLTDKLKKTYECQIENLNVMITKLTNYLKDKTIEMETLGKEKEHLNKSIEEHRKAIKSLEDEVKTEKQNIDKMITDFDAERQELKNMITVTESVMEDQKTVLNNIISEHLKAKENLQDQVNELTQEVNDTEKKYQSIETAFNAMLSLLRRERTEKDLVEKESETLREYLDELVRELNEEKISNASVVASLELSNKDLAFDLDNYKKDLEVLQKDNEEMKIVKDSLEKEIKNKAEELSQVILENSEEKKTLKEQIKYLTDSQALVNDHLASIDNLVMGKEKLELEKGEMKSELEALKITVNNEQKIKHELEESLRLRKDLEHENISLVNKCTTFQDYKQKAEKVLEERQNEIISLQKEVDTLQAKVVICEQDSQSKDGLISKISREKDAVINTISKELEEQKLIREKCKKELENLNTVLHEFKNNMELRALRKENEQLIRVIGQQETSMCQDKAAGEKYKQDHQAHHQVDTSSDNSQSFMESIKTITYLENFVHDKNRTITTLQQDIKYMKSLMAESETNLLDAHIELKVCKEKVKEKNEEIAELKKQVIKMSVTENRASQIIAVSAKYQAIILRRIAEIKSNTILKELTNFGNTFDNDLRRGPVAGTVTMEDLENFIETTDTLLKRCSEKQVTLPKERDRVIEVNRKNESEILNLKKFLTELSVSFQTFSSVKDMYAQKLSRVISVQRTVRRDILNLDSHITDAAMCKLERGYAAVMQDLSECAMNLGRWVERCISRIISVDKIKQAFTSDTERSSLAALGYQNTGLEVQLDELDKSFRKLLKEVVRAQKGDGAKETLETTIMEVRAEYEDKLTRMKAKMKDLLNEQMEVLKVQQREEISVLERELQKTRKRMDESKIEYEKYIQQLTKELWNVGEKYLGKNDEAEWLRKKQKWGSLMSLQHVHSSGLIQPQEALSASRPSEAASSLSLQATNNTKKREGRQMHMSDEEGEVFDNRWLKELSVAPQRRRDPPPDKRLSELMRRNSLCPPHLKSVYPTETQLTTVLDEEVVRVGAGPAKPQRKEVGITAYKKPGPPTPSKQAGRLSATSSELREALRVEDDPYADRKASTPARIRNFLRFSKNDSNEGTPRTKRLSNIFRKKR